MKDNYEPANVVEFGNAEQIVLGTKRFPVPECDALYGCGFSTQPLPDDIDETDE